MKLGLGVLLSAGQPLPTILDEMTLRQLSLAAECITLARVDFAQKVYLDPLMGILQAMMKKKPTTSAEKRRKRKSGKPDKNNNVKTPGKTKQERAENRDARMLKMAQHLKIDIEDG